VGNIVSCAADPERFAWRLGALDRGCQTGVRVAHGLGRVLDPDGPRRGRWGQRVDELIERGPEVEDGHPEVQFVVSVEQRRDEVTRSANWFVMVVRLDRSLLPSPVGHWTLHLLLGLANAGSVFIER